MRKYMSSMVCGAIAIVALGFGSCNSNTEIPAAISFEDSNGMRALGSARAITLSSGASLESLTQFYDPAISDIGSLVGSYTPDKFRLFIQEIVLYNSTDAVELDVPLSPASATDQTPHYADFVEDIVIQPSNPIPPGTYTGMFFFFFANPSSMGVGSEGGTDYFVPINSQVEVTIPGYGGIWVDQLGGGTDDKYSVKNLGSDKYQFSPFALQPGYWQETITGYRPGESMQRIEQFVYMQGTEYRAILPGISGHPEIWDTTDNDTAALPNYGSNGNASGIFMPFSGVDIPRSATAVEFTVSWDLDGIIEVYDRGTPEKGDDIVVLAKDFWTRFSLIPNVIE